MTVEDSIRVGRVVASEAANTAGFKVLLDEDAYLQLDDLVMVATEVPGLGRLETYGVVTETESIYEGASWVSDTVRIAEYGSQPSTKIRVAEVAVSRVDPEVWVAPDPGGEVYKVAGTERDKALYKDEMDRALPIGLGRDGAPVFADLDFFDGRKGGHMSISGISGVATKTSYALFFIRMLTAHPQIVGEAAANLRVLVFNVKGEDLLWLDKPNRYLDDEAAAGWGQLGVPAQPFDSVSFWAPLRRQSGGIPLPDTGGRMECIKGFSWTPREFIDEGLLTFLFTDASDHRNQISFVEERVRSRLKRWAVDVVGEPGAVVLREPTPGSPHRDPVVADRGEKVIRNLGDLVDALEGYLDPPEGEPDFGWSGRVQAGTVSAFMRRLYAARSRLGHLIRAGSSRRVARNAAQVTVISIQTLHDLGQRFVVGAMLKETFRDKEAAGGRLPLSVIVLDELNKYAPRDGRSPIKEMLVDIAQRGRSLGVLLVGAQQTASRVAPEVMENASLRVAGRLDAAEAERSEYGWMLPSTRARARLFKPGTMVLSQPSVPVPVVLTFPFPPWATRAEEAVEEGDPFEGL